MESSTVNCTVCLLYRDLGLLFFKKPLKDLSSDGDSVNVGYGARPRPHRSVRRGVRRQHQFYCSVEIRAGCDSCCRVTCVCVRAEDLRLRRYFTCTRLINFTSPALVATRVLVPESLETRSVIADRSQKS